MSGDSGHGFKMMPIVGQWVLNLLRDGRQVFSRWQFRQAQEKKGAEWGDAVSWRIGTTREIREVVDEQERMMKARL